jgi:hypothetical protein
MQTRKKKVRTQTFPTALKDLARGLRMRFGRESVCLDEAYGPTVHVQVDGSKYALFLKEAGPGWSFLALMDEDSLFGGQQPEILLDPMSISDSDQVAQFLVVTICNGELDESWMRWAGHDLKGVRRVRLRWSD